jgi:hypothetical protein
MRNTKQEAPAKAHKPETIQDELEKVDILTRLFHATTLHNLRRIERILMPKNKVETETR